MKMKTSHEYFACDYYRMTGEKLRPGPKAVAKYFLLHNLRFAFWFRRYKQASGLLARIMLFRLSRKYGLEISPNAVIGEGLYLGHPYNITVGEDAVLGKNVNLNKGCTIGRTNGDKGGSPIIGDNVYIGINAAVVGKIHIGHDVMIAANSFVNFDVPDHSIVLGNPAVIPAIKETAEATRRLLFLSSFK